jgi:hypothetical protein
LEYENDDHEEYVKEYWVDWSSCFLDRALYKLHFAECKYYRHFPWCYRFRQTVSFDTFRPASFISDEIKEAVSSPVMYLPVLVFIAIPPFIIGEIFTGKKRIL